jgi:biopolymer transport protein ExbD
MSKFKKKKSEGQPAISTASLPDIVFMLLFFFMVTTVMREVTLLVEISLPAATEVEKLKRKNLVSYIYVGSPTKQMQSTFGTEPRIQLNDTYATVDDIQEFIGQERDARTEEEAKALTNSIKADVDVKMGIITDVKQELRKAQSYKINYATRRDIATIR